MKRIISSTALLIFFGLSVNAQTARDANELTRLLNEFLAGASRNDPAAHERFWAEDVIYTGSAGRRRGKADILHDVRSAPAPKPGDATTVFTAEDIRIQQYGNSAIVAFRLVGTTTKNGMTRVMNFLNSGAFVKRHGKWQVVNWQSTRMPLVVEDAKKEVTEIEAAFQQAMLASDVKKLESLLDESFIWMHHDGDQATRQQILDDIASGRLKYASLETSNVTVSVNGDTAVVRGTSPRQRSSSPTSSGPGNTPFVAFYTLTFVRKDGEWKAISLHTSRKV